MGWNFTACRSCTLRAPPEAAATSMRIITLNVTGIRCAARKGRSRWLVRAEPWDVVCLQDIKAQLDDIPQRMRAPRKSNGFFYAAAKKGYAGVGLYAKRAPEIVTGFGTPEFHAEAPCLQARF